MALDNKSKLILVFIAAFLLRILFSSFGTLTLDFSTFVSWSDRLVNSGFSQFYNEWSDYLPGYLYILWFLGKLHQASSFLPLVLLYKLPAILADIGTGIIIFLTVRSFNKKWALWAAVLYLFNPAVWANSTLWGQVDGITIFLAMSALFYAWRKNGMLSAVFLAAGILVKPQAGFIVPLVGLLWWRNFGLRKSLGFVLILTLIFLLALVPFLGDKQLLPFVIERLSQTANQYPYTSVNAFNFWAILHGFWQPDDLWNIFGLIVVLLIAILLIFRWFQLNKTQTSKPLPFLFASCLLLISFLFLTRMHERHLLPTLAPLVVAAAAYPVLWISYVLLSLTYLLNLYYSFIWITQDFHQIFPQEVIILFSLLNMVAVGLMMVVFFKPRLGQSLLRVLPHFSLPAPRQGSGQASAKVLSEVEGSGTLSRVSPAASSLLVFEKHTKVLLIAILSFSLISRLIGLNFPQTFYFDEVYHAFTAREMLRGNPAVWEFWATPPEGFAYEWTHPPLAKLLMVGGMSVLGERPIGWRLPAALLGTGVVYLVYLLGLQLFKNPERAPSGQTVGILAAGVFALDGLPLVMSRIGMNDTYFLFFALLTIWLFFKEKYLLVSISLGLAVSAKWTAFWLLPILLLAMFLFRIKPRFRIFWFLIIPPLIYLASYIPFFTSGHTLTQFWETQQQMWWYHTGLEATHGYKSNAFSWPLMLRPIWFFVESPSSSSGLISNIYAMGNPLVFWLGLVSMGVVGAMGIMKKNAVLIFILVSWGLMFLPWALSPRVMFLYHYLPALPFLSLATAWFLSGQKKYIILASYFIILASYLFFFPHFTGLFVPKWLDNLYYWLPSWK